MKILQVIHKPQHRGAEVFANQLSKELVAEGHEVKIISVFEGQAKIRFNGVITSLKALPGKRFFDIAAWKRLDKIVREFKPDVVQANSGDTLKYSVLSKLIFRWNPPILFRNASEVGRYLSSPIQKKFNNLLYKKVHRVASVSRASEKDLLRHFPFLKGKTVVIPIGLEEQSAIVPVEFGGEELKHIVHVGGFSFEKNHDGLLSIFQMVLESHLQSHLHLVGDGPLREKIEIQVKEMGLEQYVSFHGFVNDPLSYIIAADVLVLPSIIEGLPGVILEAMYCKIPVVAYDVGGISEILSQSTGYLLKKNDEKAFAAAVVQALENPDKKRVENAHHLVNAEFMNKKIALKFVNSYKSLVPGS